MFLSRYSPTATEQCVRGIVGVREGKEEIEVVSALSQSGITVKARFVGAPRKGIYNFPPLVCTAVYNSYPSPQSLTTLSFYSNLFQFKFLIHLQVLHHRLYK